MSRRHPALPEEQQGLHGGSRAGFFLGMPLSAEKFPFGVCRVLPSPCWMGIWRKPRTQGHLKRWEFQKSHSTEQEKAPGSSRALLSLRENLSAAPAGDHIVPRGQEDAESLGELWGALVQLPAHEFTLLSHLGWCHHRPAPLRDGGRAAGPSHGSQDIPEMSPSHSGHQGRV